MLQAVADYQAGEWPIVPISPHGDRLAAWMSPRDATMAQEWWSDQPYGIGCRIGELFDIIELPAVLGAATLTELQHRTRGPSAVIDVPRDHWHFLVTPGATTMQELEAHRRLIRIRRDGWVPLPPTPTPNGPATWIERGTFQHSLITQAAIVAALHKTSRQHNPIDP